MNKIFLIGMTMIMGQACLAQVTNPPISRSECSNRVAFRGNGVGIDLLDSVKREVELQIRNQLLDPIKSVDVNVLPRYGLATRIVAADLIAVITARVEMIDGTVLSFRGNYRNHMRVAIGARAGKAYDRLGNHLINSCSIYVTSFPEDEGETSVHLRNTVSRVNIGNFKIDPIRKHKELAIE